MKTRRSNKTGIGERGMGIHITNVRPERESERFVVAMKGVMILKRRDLTVITSLNNGVSRFDDTTE